MAEVAVAATAATAASTTASTAFTILQGLATAVGILGTVQASQSASLASSAQAMETELQAGQEQLATTQRGTQMKRELMRVLGENDVAFAGAGIDLNGGIAANSRKNATKAATREMSIERADDDYRRALMRARAQGLRTRARSEGQAGILAAVGQGAQFGADLYKRG